MPYSTTLASWHDFSVILGAAAATLAGLLFVGLSLHLSIVVAHADVRALARVTLSNFGALLVTALLLTVPAGGPMATGIELVAVGLASAAVVGPSLYVGLAPHGRSRRVRLLLLQRFGLSILGLGGLAAAGALLLAGNPSVALGVLILATMVLLVVSIKNTWDLLVTVGEVATAERATPAGAGAEPAVTELTRAD